MAPIVGIVSNARSGRNRGGPGREARLQALAGPQALVRCTRNLDEVRAAAEEFIEAGCRYWVADGGDGTLHWLINAGRAVLEARGRLDPDDPFPFPVVPTRSGTMDFVARKVGLRLRADGIIRRLCEGVRNGGEFETDELPTLVVVGHRAGTPDSEEFRHVGFATAVGGIGQRFFARYYALPRQTRMAILEISARAAAGHLASFLPFRGPRWLDRMREHGNHLLSATPARVRVDGRTFPYDAYMGLHGGSICVDFGTMKLFPHAGTPGRLHLVAGAMSRTEASWKWLWLVAGKPIPSRRWHEISGRSMEVEARGDELLDPVIDGEMFYGFDRLRVEVGPAVRIPRLSRSRVPR